MPTRMLAVLLAAALLLITTACSDGPPAPPSLHQTSHKATPPTPFGNAPPTATFQSLTTDVDTPIDIVLTGEDPDGQALTFTVIKAPDNGALSGDAPNLTYTPNQGFIGTDTFDFQVNDGLEDSDLAAIVITVGDLPPQAFDASISTQVDTPIDLTLQAFEPNGDPLTFDVTAQPQNGALSGDAPALIYTPNPGFEGLDTFEFTVSDGQNTSEAATITINVGEPNTPPQALSQTLSTNIDTPLLIVLRGDDAEGDDLTFEIADQPQNGTLSGDAPALIYTPDDGFVGQDTFTFTVSDVQNTSEPATITIDVGNLNQTPKADPDTIATPLNTPVTVVLTGSDPEGEDLTFEVLTPPIFGQLSGDAPSLTYTPGNDFEGQDLMQFRVSDGEQFSEVSTVMILVGVDNQAPVAVDQGFATDPGQPVTVILEANDPEGATLIFDIVAQPGNGQLQGEPPNLIYTPDEGFDGEDTFTWRASDGLDNSQVATATVIVGVLNQAPFAQDSDEATPIDADLNITLEATDPDGDDLVFTIVEEPEHGALLGNAPNLTYTPDNGFRGIDRFSWRANDGQTDSETAEVTIVVGPPNTPPVALPQDVGTLQNTPIQIALEATDADNDPLSFNILRAPDNGALSGDAPNLTYTPNQGFTGIDAIAFTVNDGLDDSDAATVLVFVGQNIPPRADDQNLQTPEEQPIDLLLTGTDPDGSPLTFEIVAAPLRGQLTGVAPDLTYTPNVDFFGDDRVEFRVNDGGNDSNVATVLINVTPINDAPTAIDETLTTNEDTPAAFALLAVDPDLDPLTFDIVDPPQSGQLSGAAPNLIYTPNAEFSGTDTLRFTASDGVLTSEIAEVTLVVEPVNDAPTTTGAALSSDEDTPIDLTLQANDAESDPLAFTIIEGPDNGVLSGDAPDLTYTPRANFNGSDRIVFVASDGALTSEAATITLDIAAINDPPLALDQSARTRADQPIGIVLQASDIDQDGLTFRIEGQPTSGALSGDAPNLTYTPEADFEGTDAFTFVANDGQADSDPATITIRVDPADRPNTAPTAIAIATNTDEDTPVDIVLTGNDPEDDPLSFELVSPPQRGVLSGQPPNLTYTPNANINGADTFTYRANDGLLSSDPEQVSITINAINDPPTVFDQTLNTAEGAPIGVILFADDAENDPVTFEITAQPEDGELSGELPNLVYTPGDGFSGEDGFSFVARDAGGASETGRVTINVVGINDPPTATSARVVTVENTAIDIVLDGADADGDPLVFIVQQPPANGTLVGVAPNLTYTPNNGFSGEDALTFRVNDGQSNSDLATLTIEVTAINDAPQTENLTLDTLEGEPVEFVLVGADPDGDALTFTIVAPPSNGQISGNAPELTYTPDSGFSGVDGFTFEVSDGVLSASGEVTITVRDLDLPPAEITLDTEAGWLGAGARLEARVTDTTCRAAPTAVANPGNIELAVLEDGQGWRLQSPLLAEGVYNLNVSVESACSGLRTHVSASFGVDTTPPRVVLRGLGQHRVDPLDAATWPAISVDALVDLQVYARDGLSGLFEFSALADSGSGPRPVDSRVFPALNDPFGSGIASTGIEFCTAPDVCLGNALDVSTLGLELGDQLVILVTVSDRVGLESQARLRFIVSELEPALLAWRTAHEDHSSDSGPADASRLAAIDSINAALVALEEDRGGELVLAMEDAGARSRAASALDEGLDTTDASRDVLKAAIAKLRADTPTPDNEDARSAEAFLQRAALALDEGVSEEGFWSLTRAHFFAVLAGNPIVVDDLAGASRALSRIIAEAEGFPTMRGSAEVAALVAPLQALSAAIEGLNEDPSLTERFEVSTTLGALIGPMRAAEHSGAFTHHWQWGLAQIAALLAETAFVDYGEQIGIDHPVVRLGQDRLDALAQFEEDRRVDTAIDTATRGSACLMLALENRTAIPPRRIPEGCCDDVIAARALDGTIPRPGECLR